MNSSAEFQSKMPFVAVCVRLFMCGPQCTIIFPFSIRRPPLLFTAEIWAHSHEPHGFSLCYCGAHSNAFDFNFNSNSIWFSRFDELRDFKKYILLASNHHSQHAIFHFCIVFTFIVDDQYQPVNSDDRIDYVNRVLCLDAFAQTTFITCGEITMCKHQTCRQNHFIHAYFWYYFSFFFSLSGYSLIRCQFSPNIPLDLHWDRTIYLMADQQIFIDMNQLTC